MRLTIALGAGLLALGLSVSPAASEDTITGAARAIDADIIAFENNQRVILWGVDSPERDQTCSVGGSKYSCYEDSLRTLETLATRGEVTCELYGARDPFGRRFGRCTTGDIDIGAEMVRAGMALAFLEQAEDYVSQQEEAEAAKVGLWQEGVDFLEPWLWRKRNPGGFR